MQQEVVHGYRLSPQQRRVWLLQKDSPAFRAQCALLLKGKLDPQATTEAVANIIEQNEILRTTFHFFAELMVPAQVVNPVGNPAWRRVSLQHLDPQEREEEIDELFKQDRCTQLDFESGPLLHLTLVDLSPDEYLLFISLPSICADARTVKNLAQEIGRCYEATLRGRTYRNEAIQYIQFAEWQNGLLEDEDAESRKHYWRDLQLPLSPALRLPYEISHTGEKKFQPECLSTHAAADVVARIDAAAAEYDVPVSVIVLAAWQALLSRITGETNIIVGNISDGRQFEQLQGALGLFTKCLPVYTQFQPGFTFSEALRRVFKSIDDAGEWQDYFNLDESFQPEANAIEPDFFSFVYEFEESPCDINAGEISFAIHKHYSCVERFKIKLTAIRTGTDLKLEFHYDPGCFRQYAIDYLARLFSTVLRSAVEHPEIPVELMSIVGEVEQRQLLFEFNNTGTPLPEEKCIHHLFEEQARRTPHNVAVVFKEQQLTYEQLNARANSLAHYLKSRGVGPDTIVGLLAERSIEMIVGLLGILKAGGAYLPLDATYPKQRLISLMEEAGASVLLTQQRLAAEAYEQDQQVIFLDRDCGIIASQTDENVICETGPENLAYVIYTSGSTGKAKGVMIRHSSVVNLSLALEEATYNGLGESLRVSLNAPLTFDASVKQWAQLLRGRTLHILPEEVRYDARELIEHLSRQAIDVLDCTPSQLRFLLALGFADESNRFPGITLIGGEALDEKIWSLLIKDTAKRFYNVYGPTECTVDAIICLAQPAQSQPVIGHPIANIKAHILDRCLNPAPIGVAGELYLGGAGVARGYLNLPDQTAERFIPDPFATEPGARLYKTGDLARYLMGGEVEFIGRLDNQIKLRGFRVEPEEIEAVLKTHAAVREAAIIVREVGESEKHLVAYVAPHAETAANSVENLAGDLRGFLRKELPEFMVPAAFVFLKELPLTRNGKINRLALSYLRDEIAEAKPNYVPPGNNTERIIAKIWQQVLEVEKAGIHDNFFDLGGHSLLMARAYSQLREAFDKEFSLIEMFRYPTVSSFAEYLNRSEAENPSTEEIKNRMERQKQTFKRQRESLGKGRNR